jgi:hypothetical protein
MRNIWPRLMAVGDCRLSLSTIGCLEPGVPIIRKGFSRSGRKLFTVASMIDIVSQVMAAEIKTLEMYGYPILTQSDTEYSSCKQFRDLHTKLIIASFKLERGRCLVGDYVSYAYIDGIFYGYCVVIYKKDAELLFNIQRALKYNYLTENFKKCLK